MKGFNGLRRHSIGASSQWEEDFLRMMIDVEWEPRPTFKSWSLMLHIKSSWHLVAWLYNGRTNEPVWSAAQRMILAMPPKGWQYMVDIGVVGILLVCMCVCHTASPSTNTSPLHLSSLSRHPREKQRALGMAVAQQWCSTGFCSCAKRQAED